MAGPKSKAQELAEKYGLDPSKTVYYGSDRVVHTNPQDAVSGSKGFEQSSGGNQGSTGGCGQDASNVPGAAKDD
ncbi:MAG: hypothetical protein UV74_C0001G0036 [Candidatus Woesebacteria bacterium GW2011_GWB1_43_14]|uniref:Uncharacterized protein n=1 Tax=Candidatus Woesebacteria bacterium GW2011_GWB1_43_14 TaxID=1618578 RepID=A0A0G1FVA2_9BACT|nr:MAG: hypothetical protein UT21_C0003G0005 [Candidatus Woesebacteria bacterium GW2011_GWA1_39_11b]KKS78189.1 MAG: hypothetical protein UV51_C0002G0025 [Candidatus Woesebacteria bacterium GW2011_GWC1_42_9]KKS98926.1 MAG: hypothetical protein UV74_C0001G0036 [Candidatus Woesebacteria bacterium GW2011_GWB1_43_14]